MNNSKTGRKLNPLIAQYTAPIYVYDPIRYSGLCRWVWFEQKAGWPDEAIAECLRLAGNNIHSADNWFAYLVKLMPKAKGRASEAEGQHYKTEVGELAASFMEFIEQKKAAMRRAG